GKPRLLLSLLLLEAGRPVSVDRLVAGLWGDEPPATASKVVQGYVSRLRRLLPAGRLERREPGYLLRIEEGEPGLGRVERLRRDGSVAFADGRWRTAVGLFGEALALWRGTVLSDVADELRVPGELARLEELRLAVVEDRIEAELALGGGAQVVAELEA